MADSNSEVRSGFCFNNCNLYILLEYDNNFLVFSVCKDEQLQYPRSWGTSFLSAGVYMTVGKIQLCRCGETERKQRKNASAPKCDIVSWYFSILYQCCYDLFAQSIWKRQCGYIAQTIFPWQIPHCRRGLLCLFPSICGFLFSVAICGLSFFSWSMLRPFLPDRGLWLFVFSAPVRPESGVMRLIPPESCINVCFFSLDMVCADLIPHYLYCEVC